MGEGPQSLREGHRSPAWGCLTARGQGGRLHLALIWTDSPSHPLFFKKYVSIFKDFVILGLIGRQEYLIGFGPEHLGGCLPLSRRAGQVHVGA